MRAAELEMDRESGIGAATHATLFVQDVPILYLPYFQFPIDDRRKSGILAPSISYSDTNGRGVTVPVYWNQAPNYDMTITPTWYNESGLQLSTENRYLFSSHQGQIDLSYIDDSVYGDSRWFRQWQHSYHAYHLTCRRACCSPKSRTRTFFLIFLQSPRNTAIPIISNAICA